MQRITSIDLARGFTVLFIPAIHSVMLYSDFSVYQSVYGKVLGFIAEWPGAQILMLLMGVSFSLSKTISAKKVAIKALVLLAIGYLMNFLKFILPIQLGIMPHEFLKEYAGGKLSLSDFLLTGDILQFAALALLLLLIVHQFRYSILISLYLAVLALLASPLLWDLHSSNIFCNYILQLICGQPPHTYFPLLPWLVYPLTGFAIGIAIKQNEINIWKHLFIVGSFVCLLEFILQFTPYHFPKTEFYRTYPDLTLMHVGFAVLWLSLWHFVTARFSEGKLFAFLQFLSKNITLIYFIQWIVIFWCFSFIGYRHLAILPSILVSLAMNVTVLLLTYMLTKTVTTEKYTPQPK